MLFFFRRQLVVFVNRHCFLRLAHSGQRVGWHRLVRPRQEEHDSRDHDVCENVRYPGSEHAASVSPNDSHEQPVDTSKTNAEQAARKAVAEAHAEGDSIVRVFRIYDAAGLLKPLYVREHERHFRKQGREAPTSGRRQMAERLKAWSERWS